MRNQEFCKKYLTADWDGFAANDFFANKFDTNISEKYFGKPKNEFFSGLLQIAIAKNDVYRHIAHLAFEKNKIVSYLSDLAEESIHVPVSVDDKAKYKSIFLSTGKTILENIKQEKYDFQKPNHNQV
jgi:hypothetical protein